MLWSVLVLFVFVGCFVVFMRLLLLGSSSSLVWCWKRQEVLETFIICLFIDACAK